MDFILFFFGLIFIISGILGCILPIIPGPPLSFVGLLFIHFTDKVEFSSNFLILWAAVAIGVTVLDYIVPIWGTKKFGGSKYATWGSVIGLIIGLFAGPLGIILGPFIGAFVGELIGGKESNYALKSATGALIGFLLGTGIKLIAAGMMTYYYFLNAGKYIISFF